MKKWYKFTGVLLIGAFAMAPSNAQTHYGQGAGTQGLYHSFFGANAGAANISGAANTFLGAFSGQKNTSGGANTFVGTSAGQGNIGGSSNVFVGVGSGNANTLGGENNFVGVNAGLSNLDGGKNNFFGAGAGEKNVNGFENSFFGDQTGPDAKGSKNAFFGARSGFLTVVGGKNTFLGYSAGHSNVNGERNTYVGYAADGDATLVNATALGSQAKVTASNSLVLGYKANVGIGISSPSFQLHLNTDLAAKAGSPDWIVASDSRLKKNITDFTDGLDLLKQIRPVWFQYNGSAGIETGDRKFVGIVAQEMQKIAPYTVGTFSYQDSLGNKTEYLDYDANAVTYILINSVKEQQQVIEEKDAQIRDLAARVERLEKLLSSPGNFHTDIQGASLEQNAPNGFSDQTSIRYYIPEFAQEAVIHIYNVSGTKIGSHVIKQRGAGELVISAQDFSNGVHVYDLVVDGKSVGGKKMLIQK